MATFPSYVRIDWREMTETPDTVVERSEMERGRPKQRRINSDVRMEVRLVLHFDSAADVANFETWYYTTINAGITPFDWVHPRTGATLQANVVGGGLGPLSYLNQTLRWARRPLTIEYWRSAW